MKQGTWRGRREGESDGALSFDTTTQHVHTCTRAHVHTCTPSPRSPCCLSRIIRSEEGEVVLVSDLVFRLSHMICPIITANEEGREEGGGRGGRGVCGRHGRAQGGCVAPPTTNVGLPTHTHTHHTHTHHWHHPPCTVAQRAAATSIRSEEGEVVLVSDLVFRLSHMICPIITANETL